MTAGAGYNPIGTPIKTTSLSLSILAAHRRIISAEWRQHLNVVAGYHMPEAIRPGGEAEQEANEFLFRSLSAERKHGILQQRLVLHKIKNVR